MKVDSASEPAGASFYLPHLWIDRLCSGIIYAINDSIDDSVDMIFDKFTGLLYMGQSISVGPVGKLSPGLSSPGCRRIVP